jgi:ATP-binding cassette subfamily B protein
MSGDTGTTSAVVGMQGPRFETLRAIWLLAGMGFRAEPRAALLVAALVPFEFACGALQALALKWLADAAAGRSLQGILAAGGLLALVLSTWRVAGGVAFTARMRLSERTSTLMRRRLGELTAAISTIEHFERPEYLKELDLVRQDGGGALSTLFSQVVIQCSTVGRLALTVGLLATLHPWLALLPLFGVPSLLASARAQKIRQRMSEQVAELRRLEYHLSVLSWTEPPAKEVRVFGLGDEILRRHQAVRAAVDRLEDGENLKATLLTALGWLVFAAGFVGAIVLVVRLAVEGRATVGDVVLLMVLAGQVNGQVASLAGTVTWALNNLKVAGRYVWLAEYARAATRRPLEPAPVPDRLEGGITLDHVTFVYPGTDKVVLADVNLRLPAGTTVAVVGENGAGKTTLIKLLCRLYEPSEGRVLVDGIDARRFDVEEWRSRLSAGFQDFARFMLLTRASVGVGELSQVDDATAVMGALERAHAADVVATLPRGLDQQLGRYFKDGTWLSDGQWQKLALGRAMMRPTPLLLVLDEPTAALDAPSEHTLFERYAGAAQRAAAANGGITVLVSHRFSTVRMADVIVVLDRGRVAAFGTHAELMRQGGLYAELYELQARAYRA